MIFSMPKHIVVIGVIAAITVPTLMNSYRKQQYVSALKKSYATLQNGLKSYIISQGGTGLQDTDLWKGVVKFNEQTDMFAAPKEFNKIFNAVDYALVGDSSDEHFMSYKWLNGQNTKSMISLYEYMADGTIVYINASSEDMVDDEQRKIIKQLGAKHTSFYANIAIDVNGESKPNIVGRDLFKFALTGDGTLVPCGSRDYCLLQYGNVCSSPNGSSWDLTDSVDYTCHTDGEGCAARIIDEGWEMKY